MSTKKTLLEGEHKVNIDELYLQCNMYNIEESLQLFKNNVRENLSNWLGSDNIIKEDLINNICLEYVEYLIDKK